MTEFNLICKRCGRIYEADEPVTDIPNQNGYYICDDCYEELCQDYGNETDNGCHLPFDPFKYDYLNRRKID